MFRSFCRVIILSFCLLPSIGSADSRRDLSDFVSQPPRDSILGEPFYWMEMETAVGWEKMMLVFGYASNRPVCDLLVRVASVDSPERQFRCVEAN